jgi:hypothetical protein
MTTFESVEITPNRVVNWTRIVFVFLAAVALVALSFTRPRDYRTQCIVNDEHPPGGSAERPARRRAHHLPALRRLLSSSTP